jgi:serine/threonine protein kinase
MDYINPSSRIGQSITTPIGDIVLSEMLGHGSFAVVYKGATQSQPDKSYAIKTLFKQNLTPKQLQIQKVEAALHTKVSSHPNVITLHCVTEDDDCVYLVLDYWRNGDLFDTLIDDINPITGSAPKESIELFRQIVSAIQWCHKQGVYHRDLKPENILLDRDDKTGKIRAGIADFGLATDDEFSSDYACGSLRYMSPQCFSPISGKAAGYSTSANDVWSLGIILINLLTRKNPWSEPSENDPMYQEWSSGSEEIRFNLFVKQFSLSKEIDEIIRGCFALEMTDRISVDNLALAIENIISKDIEVIVQPDAELDSVAVPSMTIPNESHITWNDSEMNFLDEPFPSTPTTVNNDQLPFRIDDFRLHASPPPVNTENAIPSTPINNNPLPVKAHQKKKRTKRNKISKAVHSPSSSIIAPPTTPVKTEKSIVAPQPKVSSILGWVVASIKSLNLNETTTIPCGSSKDLADEVSRSASSYGFIVMYQ